MKLVDLKQRLFIYSVLLFGLVVGLAPVRAQGGDEEVTLVIWGEPGMVNCINEDDTWAFCEYVRLLNDRWHAQHPSIRLVWEDEGWDQELHDNLLSAIADGTAPDITTGEVFMPRLVDEGVLAPLNLPADVRDNLIPAPVRAVTHDGDLYGVSVFTAVFTLEVNADVALVGGLNPSDLQLSTWDEVLSAAEAIVEAGDEDFYGYSILGPTNAPSAALFRAAPYIYQTGASLCATPDCDVPLFNDPLAVPAYEWFRALYQTTTPEIALSGSEGFVFTNLFVGVTGMQTAGSWHIDWARDSGCGECRYFPLPLPEGGTRANVVVGNPVYAALADSDQLDEAQQFLAWLVSDEVQNAVFWTGVAGRLPTTHSAIRNLQAVAEGDTSSIPDFYSEALGKSLDNAPGTAADYDVFIDELLNGDVRILPHWQPQVAALWNEMYVEVLTSDEPVADILDAYQAQAEALAAAAE